MIEIPNPDVTSSVADWVELVVAISNDSISKATLSTALEQTSGNETPDSLLSSVWRELAGRASLYQSAHYCVDDRTIGSVPEQASPEYLTCLFLSLYGLPVTTQLPSKLFERITCKAIQQYLSGKTIVFGWPFDPEDDDNLDQESLIGKKIKGVASNIGEKFIEAPPSRFKDRGVDVIGWIPFSEGRSGQIVLLIQCAAGHDWKTKLPVPIDAWCEYIHWANNPIKAYAVTCVVDEKDWHETNKDKGILLDRIRIMNLLSNGLDDQNLSNELVQWVNEQINLHDRS